MYFNILYWILILTIVVSTVLLGSEWSSWGCCRFGADKLSFFYPHGWSNVLLNSTCICAVGSPLWIFHNSKACRLEKVWVPPLTTSSTLIQLRLLFGWSYMRATHSTLHTCHLWLHPTHFLIDNPTIVYFLSFFFQFFILRLYPWHTCTFFCWDQPPPHTHTHTHIYLLKAWPKISL